LSAREGKGSVVLLFAGDDELCFVFFMIVTALFMAIRVGGEKFCVVGT
jgi:hypothetical protein